jgi:hypothetical protein
MQYPSKLKRLERFLLELGDEEQALASVVHLN